MSKPKIYGYEELIRMDRQQLIEIYNRNVERINRQVSRMKKVAPNLKSPELKRLPRFRKKDESKSNRDIVKDIVGAQNRKGLAKANAKTMNDISVLVGQSYYGREHDDAFKSNWVAQLTAEQLQAVRDKIDQMGMGFDDYEIWYRIQHMGYVGDQITPIRSYDDLMRTLGEVDDFENPKNLDIGEQSELYADKNPYENNLISDEDMEDYWVNQIMKGGLF